MVRNPFSRFKLRKSGKEEVKAKKRDSILTEFSEETPVTMEKKENTPTEYYETIISTDSATASKETSAPILTYETPKEYARHSWENVSEIERKIDNLTKKSTESSKKSEINNRIEWTISRSDSKKKNVSKNILDSVHVMKKEGKY